jgi:hypothetical protein
MSIAAFLAHPWRTSHASYDTSVINIRPAPEFSTAEVAVASLYRACGFPGYSENEVSKAGRELDRASVPKRSTVVDPTRISTDGWRTILHGVLESPKQPKQSSKRFVQLCPIVPDTALYSGSARLSGNSWNPGQLIQRMVQLGSTTPDDADQLWRAIFAALSVSEADDIWARWLEEEFERRRKPDVDWQYQAMTPMTGDLAPDDKEMLRYPARQFVRDIDAVLRAKEGMTRRQWMSLLEAIVRLAMVTHVLWLCSAGARMWKSTSAILGRGDAAREMNPADVRGKILAGDQNFLSYGNQAIPRIRDATSRYLDSRLGLNLVLWTLDEIGANTPSLVSAADISAFLGSVAQNQAKLLAAGFWKNFDSLQGTEARTIACKNGIGSNLMEFSRHTLGQRLTATETLRGYDQGYYLRKRSESANSPWILSLGPVAVLAVVHCCLSEAAGPRSVRRLSDHLAWYGLDIDVDDIASSDLGRNLRMLGLVLDSPDAESGMLLVPPFLPTFLREPR